MSTNWIGAYGNKRVRRFQAGGPMGGPPPGPEGAAPGGAPDLEGMLMEYAQTRDPQLAVAIADALVEMMMAQQGGAPAGPGGPPPPEGGAPMARGGMRTSRAPIFRK